MPSHPLSSGTVSTSTSSSAESSSQPQISPNVTSATASGQIVSIISDDQQDLTGEHLTFGDRFKDFIMDNQVVVNTFIAGGLAGAASRTVVSPLERLKIILQVQAVSSQKSIPGQAYGGVWSSLGRMWKEEGMRGFMKGNGINVVRILPYSALQFTSYGGFKSLLRNWSGEESLSTPLRLAAGAGAGIVAVSATYPLDLVRARLSIATANVAMGASTSTTAAFTAEDAKLGIVGMTKKVYATEGGIRGLYRGCWATAVGVAPYVSLNFYLYESMKSYVLPSDLIHDPSVSEADLAVKKLLCGAFAGGTALLFTHPFDVLRRKLQVAGLSRTGPQYSGALDAMRRIIVEEGFWKGMYRGLVPNIIKVTPSIAVSFYTFETVKDLLAKWEHLEEREEDKVV